ncbi:hypothetical protein C8Q76DRAFT_692470 [Earliella scabrosa]|nr:hypothetical protein C8Q76DRAFT_692470 [Earliella scabrosa]
MNAFSSDPTNTHRPARRADPAHAPPPGDVWGAKEGSRFTWQCCMADSQKILQFDHQTDTFVVNKTPTAGRVSRYNPYRRLFDHIRAVPSQRPTGGAAAPGVEDPQGRDPPAPPSQSALTTYNSPALAQHSKPALGHGRVAGGDQWVAGAAVGAWSAPPPDTPQNVDGAMGQAITNKPLPYRCPTLNARAPDTAAHGSGVGSASLNTATLPSSTVVGGGRVPGNTLVYPSGAPAPPAMRSNPSAAAASTTPRAPGPGHASRMHGPPSSVRLNGGGPGGAPYNALPPGVYFYGSSSAQTAPAKPSGDTIPGEQAHEGAAPGSAVAYEACASVSNAMPSHGTIAPPPGSAPRRSVGGAQTYGAHGGNVSQSAATPGITNPVLGPAGQAYPVATGSHTSHAAGAPAVASGPMYSSETYPQLHSAAAPGGAQPVHGPTGQAYPVANSSHTFHAASSPAAASGHVYSSDAYPQQQDGQHGENENWQTNSYENGEMWQTGHVEHHAG